MKKADGIVVVYDLAINSNIWERKWISFVLQHKKKETDVIFMGNKSDIINNYGQIISQSLTREYQLKYVKVSTVTGLNISEAMNELVC